MLKHKPWMVWTVWVLVGMLTAGVVSAQWSSDPAANLVLSDRTGPQVQAKIVSTADGGAYVSWFDNGDGGYDVYLQRLNAAGVEQWAHNGILVKDRGYSSTQDYGLAVDTAGNALLAFRDDSGATDQITAAKVDPSGTLLWGAAGVQLTDTTDFVAAPKITGTTDGNVVVAWTQELDTVAQKLSPAGMPMWGAGAVLSSAGMSLSASDLQASDSGHAIVAMVASAGGPSARELWAQKLDGSTGASLWTSTHVRVFDGGSLQFGNFPTFLSDGSGGAVFAWYSSSPSLQVRAQRISAAGAEVFAHDGVEVSTNGSQLRVSPSVTYVPGTGETLVFWEETDTLQSDSGLYGQKLDASGVRQWTDSGRVLVALSPTQISSIRSLPLADGALVAWIASVGVGNEPIRGTRVDGAGAFVWDPGIVDLSTSATESSRLVAASSTAGFGMFAWADGGPSAGDIKAQNLNSTGTLGADNLFVDGFESGDTTAWSATVP